MVSNKSGAEISGAVSERILTTVGEVIGAAVGSGDGSGPEKLKAGAACEAGRAEGDGMAGLAQEKQQESFTGKLHNRLIRRKFAISVAGKGSSDDNIKLRGAISAQNP